MRITYHDGSTDLPYKDVPDEYITVSYCDISDHRPPHGYYDKHITERKNGRADYYILFVTSGSITVYIDGEELRAHVGDLVVYYPFAAQKIVKCREDNPSNYWVHFNGYAVPEILSQCGITKSGIYKIGKVEVISDVFKQMMLTQRLGKNKIHINSIFLHLMSLLASEAENMLPDTPTGFSHAERVMKGIVQMEWEYRNPRKISEYARICGMSPGRFSVVFREATGKSPSGFIEEIRVSKAKDMLLKTSLSVSDIAENVGYRDALYFSRVFRKSQGISPTAFRKKRLYFGEET